MLLQLRTYATAGRVRFLAYLFIIIDLIASLAALCVHFQEEKDLDPEGHHEKTNTIYGHFRRTTDNHYAYDPILWMVLAAVDFLALIANVWLVRSAYRDWKWNGGKIHKLMWIVLRDNIFYLTL